MVTYISTLPKDLRNELKYFMNAALGRITKTILYRFTISEVASLQNGVPIMNNFMNTLIPTTLQSKVSAVQNIAINYMLYIEITSTHLVTPMILMQMLNYTYNYRHNKRDGYMPLSFHDFMLVREFNKALLEVGYIERITFNPRNDCYELVS